MEQLTEELKKQCVLFLQCFRSAYYSQMGVKLTTVDQIIDVISKKIFTFDDVFDTYLENCVGRLTEYLSLEDSIFFDDNLEMFDVVNYFPEQKRLPEGGAWIKIRNKNGFEIHFAKIANRKRRFDEEIEGLQRKLTGSYKSSIKNIETLTPAKKEKQAQIKAKLSELHIRDLIKLKPYEVQINRTKSLKEYYLPYQYEIVSNIEDFSNAYIDALPGVKIKPFYTSKNEDAVFYLRSRGIPLKLAQIMAAMKQTYFVIDMNVAMDAYNENFRKTVKFVEV